MYARGRFAEYGTWGTDLPAQNVKYVIDVSRGKPTERRLEKSTSHEEEQCHIITVMDGWYQSR